MRVCVSFTSFPHSLTRSPRCLGYPWFLGRVQIRREALWSARTAGHERVGELAGNTLHSAFLDNITREVSLVFQYVGSAETATVSLNADAGTI